MRFIEFKLTNNGFSPALQTATVAETIAQLMKFIIEHPPGTVVSLSRDFIRVHEGGDDPTSPGLWITRLRDDETRFFECFIKELTMLTGCIIGHRDAEHVINRLRSKPYLVRQALECTVVLTKSDIDPQQAYAYIMDRVRTRIPPSRRTVSSAQMLAVTEPISTPFAASA